LALEIILRALVSKLGPEGLGAVDRGGITLGVALDLVAVGRVRDIAALAQDLVLVHSVANHIEASVFSVAEFATGVERWVIWLGNALDFQASSTFLLDYQLVYLSHSIQLHRHPTSLEFSS